MEKRQYEFEMSLDDPSLDEDQNQAGLKFSSIFFRFYFSSNILLSLYKQNKMAYPREPKKTYKSSHLRCSL